MAMHPIDAASSHPELRSSDPQSPSRGLGSPVPTTQEKIPQLRFPSLDSGARRVKPPIDSETFETGRHALTSPRSRKGIFHLPVPLQTRAAGVPLGGGALSEALRPWNPRSWGIPVQPGHPAPAVLWEIPGRGRSRPEWTPQVQCRTFGTQICNHNCTSTLQCHPLLGGKLRVPSSSYRTPGSGLPALASQPPRFQIALFNFQHSQDSGVQNLQPAPLNIENNPTLRTQFKAPVNPQALRKSRASLYPILTSRILGSRLRAPRAATSALRQPRCFSRGAAAGSPI